MIKINLLPKEYKKKSFDFSLGKTGFYGMVGAAAVIVLLIVVSFYQSARVSTLDNDIAKARQRAAMLEKDIRLVDALTDVKQKITKRMSAVERLDSHRSSWVRLLEDIGRNVPDFVWVGKFTESDGSPVVAQETPDPNNPNAAKQQAINTSGPTVRNGEIQGFAFTLNALASFMIKMMRSDYFDEVELVSTKELTVEKKKVYNFTLNFNVHYLSDEELRNLVASANVNTDRKTAGHKSLN